MPYTYPLTPSHRERDELIDTWLRASTWRDLREFWYGGLYHCEARIYPEMNNAVTIIGTGSGDTPHAARTGAWLKIVAYEAAEARKM